MKSESFLNFGKVSTVDDGRSRGIHRDPRGIHTSMLTPDQNLCSDLTRIYAPTVRGGPFLNMIPRF